uniref:Transposase n=1 Tax=Neogobius melanostomus TaxID=47308 RepID=A0A8C6UUE3_9GOBI
MVESHKQMCCERRRNSGTWKVVEPTSNYTWVCGFHFITGEKSNDETHPDYVPSIFPTSSSTSAHPESKISRHPGKNERATRKATMKKTSPRKRQKSDLSIINQEVDGHHKEDPTFEDDREAGILDNEREQFCIEIEHLRRERDEALATVETLEKLIQDHVQSLSSAELEGNDQKCVQLTGLKWNVFQQLFTFVSSFIVSKASTNYSLPLREQLLLTLVKLRHNVCFEFLAVIMGIPETTCTDYFWKWIELLHGKVGFMVKWPDRENIYQMIPHAFHETFPRLTCIVDCFEIFIDAPKNLVARALCCSHDKELCTVKVLVGCNPLGTVTYLSRAWGGRASDVQIVRDSGFIDSKYHHPGDQILADRSFALSEEFANKCSCEFLTPALKGQRGRKQLSAWEVENSRKISSVRIHTERVIGLMKNRFTILKGPMPLRCVQRLRDESFGNTLASCDKIITVCAALTNMGESIVYSERA